MLFNVDFPLPTYPERKRLWHEYAGNGTSAPETLHLAALAAQFRFTRREIRNAVAMAKTRAVLREGVGAQAAPADLEAACRAESNSRLSGFARKIESAYAWDDLVLPQAHKNQLGEIIDYIRNHEAVYTEWGFSRKHFLGKGVNMLFSGPSGTGKTMAAGIISAELGLDCYKIDLSTVVSKYIGETEKNLNRIFAEAETSNAVLFFDEADALFGKRTEVKDSHDRYANIEVNYLLQKMEEHEGVVILATNLSKNVDDAFLRRVHFSVVFPFPEKDERLLVWRRVFPEEAPVGEDIDWDFLARRLKITGGNIKNIALGAAFLAKRENHPTIDMRHVVLSAKREFQKTGKLCTKADFGDYYELVA
jgi:SpoVK/Ycf46/Vps4 family AAA+-type ATPase